MRFSLVDINEKFKVSRVFKWDDSIVFSFYMTIIN